MRLSLNLGFALDAVLFRPFEARSRVEDAVLSASPTAQVRVLGGFSILPDLDSALPEVVDEVVPRLVDPPPSDFLPLFQGVSPGPVGGRLANFVQNWRVITSDAFIISVVTHGYLISPTPEFPGVLREYTSFPGKVSAQVV